jgi:hypothetical protein
MSILAYCLKNYSIILQGNRKILEGASRRNKNAQFENIPSKVKAFLSTEDPII